MQSEQTPNFFLDKPVLHLSFPSLPFHSVCLILPLLRKEVLDFADIVRLSLSVLSRGSNFLALRSTLLNF